MMIFKYIDPEVAGSLGDDTIMDTSTHPPIVLKLHYEFSGWLGNDLLESFPCFIVTDKLGQALLRSSLTGFSLDSAKTTTNEQFRELYPQRVLPLFYWLKVVGQAGKDDFGISTDLRLVISEKAFQTISAFNIDAADIEDFEQ